jgi:6-phosphogluconolactonase
MSTHQRIIHSNAFAVDAANVILEAAQRAIDERGAFRLGLSGGNTPRAVYAELAKNSGDMPWDKVLITFGDERCVGPEHEESNYRMARESLLSRVPIPSGNVLRIWGEFEPEAAAEAYEKELAAKAAAAGEERYVHDLLLLGLGNDGHTASLFPGTAALEEKVRNVVANYVPGVSAHRVTLTYPIINAARHVLFLVEGAAKQAIVGDIIGNQGNYPAARVRPVSGELTWLLGF